MDLTQAATRMADGEEFRVATTNRSDELGVLTRTFVRMRADIQRRIGELQQLNAALDQRGEERTTEVKTLQQLIN